MGYDTCAQFAAAPRVNGTVLAYTCAMDNYEPFPRVVASGYLVSYPGYERTPDGRGPVTGGLWIPGDGDLPLSKLQHALIIADDGNVVVPHYCAGWNETPRVEDSPVGYALFHPFPLSVGTRPDNGRPVDMSGWMLGPRTAYHLKISAA